MPEPPQDHASESTADPSDLRRRRLAQVLTVLFVAVAGTTVTHLLWSPSRDLPWSQFATLALLVVAGGLLRRGAQEAAAGLIMASMTAMLLNLIVLNEGLRDEALLGLPGVLVVAALLGNRRQLLTLVAMMLAVVGLLGWANLSGLYVNPVRPVHLATVVDVSAILVAVAFMVGLLASDLDAALRRLREENDAVRQSRSQVEFLATHDALTGLPNRLMVRDRFDRTAAAARRGSQRVALLYIDLDHFKTVNDSLGHGAGDALLCSLAQQLQRLLRAGDTVSRQGGDEFVVLLENIPSSDAAAEVAGKVLALLSQPQSVEGVDVHLGASIGVAIFPDDGGSFDALLKKADIAMYRAKHAGRGNFMFFDAAMNESVVEHLQFVSGMRRALERGEFVLHYQPQFALADERIVGAEALLRWRDPQRGMVPPGRFISVAEQSGQIVDIGAWVLMEACRQAQAWRKAGLEDFVISVNLSPVQVRRGVVERDVMAALAVSGLPPGRLELEFTESLLIEDSESLRGTLARLRGLGVRFSIDDFGTGYSNLSYLKLFEVERLKIDQSFVRRLIANPDDDAIVRAILQMASALRLGVIAEGIEDAPTLARLRALGCEQGQGFHWARALPADEFLRFADLHVERLEDTAAALNIGA